MLHACVRTFDVTVTVENFLGTKQGLIGISLDSLCGSHCLSRFQMLVTYKRVHTATRI